MKINYLEIFFLSFFFLLFHYSSAQKSSPKKKKPLTIAFLQDGSSYKLDDLRKKFANEIEIILGPDYKLKYVVDSASAQFDSLSLVNKLDEFQGRQDIDIILGVGPLVSEIIARGKGYEKPVVGTTVFAFQVKNDLPVTPEHTTGVKNMIYLDAMLDPMRDFEIAFKLKSIKKMAVIICPSIAKVFPQWINFDRFFEKYNSSYTIIEAKDNAREVLSQVSSEEFDAVYLGPLYEMGTEEEVKLINGLTEKKLFTYAMYGREDVEKGLLSGIFTTSNYDRLGTEVARYVQQIVEGESPDKLVIDLLSFRENLYINRETARKIGYSLEWKVLNDAVLIPAEGITADRELSLQKAVAEAIDYNLEAQIARQQVLIGFTIIRFFRSSLLPQLYLVPTLSWIEFGDEPGFISPEPQFLGLLMLQVLQMIYDESEVARYEISRRRQVAREARKEQVELDVIQEAAFIYLELLKRNLIESVQTRNLKFSRENLHIAYTRKGPGIYTDSEVSRWKTEISFGRSALLDAKINRRNTEMKLNRLLVRPIGEYLNISDVHMEGLEVVYLDDRIKPLWDDPINFDAFTDFLVGEAKRYLPELKRVNAELYAQKRAVKWRERRFYVPSFYFEGGVIYRYLEEGEGIELEPIFINLPIGSLEENLSWTFGIRATYPITNGGRRNALLQQAKLQLSVLQKEQEQVLLDLELNIRRQMQILRAAYADIRFFRNAETEAFNNFYRMQYEYRRGNVTIIRLIDAQSSAVRARQSSVNATYKFIQDIFMLERRLGFYTFLYTPLEKELFIQRLITFLK